MHQTIHLIQSIMGLGAILALLGWCAYRLAILFGLVIPKKRPKRSVRQSVTDQSGKSTKGRQTQQSGSNLSRRTLYSARRERN